MRTAIPAALLGCVAALALAATPATAAPFDVRLQAPNHHPKGGAKDWRITVTARTASGKPLRATAVYHFLYGGRVVSTQYPNPGRARGGSRPYAFHGRYSDTILWPKRAAGYRLTFRVAVTVRGKGTVNRDWWVRVRR
jgi:hypothetical protein